MSFFGEFVSPKELNCFHLLFTRQLQVGYSNKSILRCNLNIGFVISNQGAWCN